MSLRMVGEYDLAPLSISLRYLSFSEAYLDSALRLCAVLKRSSRKSNYARGAVVLYLAFHPIELFLKGAILEQKPNEKLINHNIHVLGKRYSNLYPGRKYEFRAPFIPEELGTDVFLSLLGPEHLDEIKISEFGIFLKERERNNPSDQRYRYPTNAEGKEWSGVAGFEPVSFLIELKKLKADMARLAELIFPANNTLRIPHLKPGS